jgi:hypothetical protein
MEHDRREGAHNHPSYQTQTAHTHCCKRESSSRLPAGVIVITPTRASDSDFTEERPPKKTSPQQPNETCVGLCQTDDSSHRRLAALILTMSSEEEICKTCAEEDHHDRTAHHMASSPQVQATAAPISQQGKINAKSLGYAGTESDYQSHCRDQTITHQHRCCRASHHAEPSHCRTTDHNVVCVQPTKRHRGGQIFKVTSKGGKQRQHDARRLT